ncbi:hypothetical protein F7725_010566 [Dissostichus mawsoni]|uniref:Uncharacterized protein n=1 Tax=Dissostichus mawsoni TaxID=36200 RepID=A0A7J5XRT9_DISMA|nr:hypothetical protein F7725_010566 [Dissostichus mawsoni]
MIEYRGELISKQECERRLKLYPVRLKMVKNSDCTESYTKTTGPVLSPLSRAEKGLDEVMPLETCGATQATSPNEEMVKNSDCTESYTKTTGPVLSPLSRAEKHCLRIATISSLDRWFPVWDLCPPPSGLDMNAEPSENSFRDELQSNQSDSEKDQISDECMSDENTYPTHKGMMMIIIQMQVMPSQSKAGQIQFKTLTDVGKNYPSDTSLPVLPSTSKDWPPLDMAIDATTSGPSISNKDSYKKKPKAKAELPKQHLTMSTKNYCFICGKPQSKISRHLRTHKTHAEIIHAFSLPEHSKERRY